MRLFGKRRILIYNIYENKKHYFIVMYFKPTGYNNRYHLSNCRGNIFFQQQVTL